MTVFALRRRHGLNARGKAQTFWTWDSLGNMLPKLFGRISSEDFHSSLAGKGEVSLGSIGCLAPSEGERPVTVLSQESVLGHLATPLSPLFTV